MLEMNSKCHIFNNSPTNGPTGMQLGWSHPIMPPTCPPWCGSRGNGRCLATAHCTFSSYGCLEAEQVNQFWWNLVNNSKLGPQWQSRDQILKFLKFDHVTVIAVLICCCIPNFIKIGSRVRPPDANNCIMFNAPLLGNARCHGNQILGDMSRTWWDVTTQVGSQSVHW